jgi:hypothetical protein
MLKQDQTHEADREVAELVDLGAASEVTLASGNYRKELNQEPRIYVD